MAQHVKKSVCNAGATGKQVQSLGQEDPLEENMATHSSSLTWRIQWIEEPDRLQSIGSGCKESDTTEVTEHTYMHPKTAHGTLSKIHHMLGHKTSLKKY